jgi:TM2 domain-containing membrane protein YozV
LISYNEIGLFTLKAIQKEARKEMSTEITMQGPGSTGNVISALASFFYPGLGQLIQGRWISALIFFVTATALWFVLLGWIMHIWATIDAARFRG